MSEEIERRLALSRGDKCQITEIIESGDAIDEIKITFKSGNIMILR